jgi:ferrous iron transport protein A
MNLAQLEKNQKGVIKQILAQSALKKRLFSLGIGIDKEITVLETSLQKNTIKIALGQSAVALRLDEAKLIEIEVGA